MPAERPEQPPAAGRPVSRRRGSSPRRSSRPAPPRARGPPPAPARPPSRTASTTGSPACRPTGRSGPPRRSPGRGPRRRRRPDRGRAPARPRRRAPEKWAEPCVAQRWKTSSPSGQDAVGRIATRGLERPVEASRPASKSAIAGRNSPDPTRATGPGMRESIAVPVPHCRNDPDPALDARRGDHRLGRRLPRRDDREPRPAGDRQELPTTFLGVLEGQAYIVSGYLAVLAALLILVRRPRRLLRPAADLRDRPDRLRPRARCCAGSPRTSSCSSCSGSSRERPARCSCRARCRSSRRRSRARPGRGRSGLWAAATSALTLFGQPIGGLLVDLLSWRVAFLINVPLVAIALWATIRHMQESRDETATGSLRLARRGRRRRSRSAGSRSARSRGQQTNWQDTLAWVALVVGAIALVALPVPHAPAAPARAAVAVPDPRLRGRSTSRRS